MFFYEKGELIAMKFISIPILTNEKIVIIYKDFRLVITGEHFLASLFRKEEIHLKGNFKTLEIKYEE